MHRYINRDGQSTPDDLQRFIVMKILPQFLYIERFFVTAVFVIQLIKKLRLVLSINLTLRPTLFDTFCYAR